MNEDRLGAADRVDRGRELDWGPALPGRGSVGGVDNVENLDAIESEILAATPRIWVVEIEKSGHYEAPIRETSARCSSAGIRSACA